MPSTNALKAKWSAAGSKAPTAPQQHRSREAREEPRRSVIKSSVRQQCGLPNTVGIFAKAAAVDAGPTSNAAFSDEQ